MVANWGKLDINNPNFCKYKQTMTEKIIDLKTIQRTRRHFLIILALVALGLRLFSTTSYINITYTILGLLLVGFMAFGRAYCMTYIAERKSKKLVTWGPYSMCRNPLYFFSVLGGAGVGLLLQSVILAIIGAVGVYGIFMWVIGHEERALSDHFGAEYDQFRAQTPFRILPNPFLYQRGAVVAGGNSTYLIKRTFWQAIIFWAVFLLNPLAEFAQQYITPVVFLP